MYRQLELLHGLIVKVLHLWMELLLVQLVRLMQMRRQVKQYTLDVELIITNIFSHQIQELQINTLPFKIMVQRM